MARPWSRLNRQVFRARFIAAGALAASTAISSVCAQQPYRQPPAEIVRILDAPPQPAVSLNPQRTVMLLIDRESMPPVSELAKPMLRLAGDRINPHTNGPFTTFRFVGLTLKRVAEDVEIKIALPGADDANIGSLRWSPDGSRFAFTVTRDHGIELWVGDVATATARQLTGPNLNATGGAPLSWLPDGRRLLCMFIPEGRGPAPQPPAAPTGPVVQENFGGPAAPVRTYQDLLKSPHDEALFEYYFTAQPAIVDAETGQREDFGEPGIYTRITASPTGRFFLVSRTVRPYSYLVPWDLFPEIVELRDEAGRVVREIARVPLRETIPIQGVQTGPRSFTWQGNVDDDVLLWVEALDEGDPRNKVPHRDRIMRLAGLFQDAEPVELFRLEHRYRGLTWFNDPTRAMVSEYDRDRRWTRTWLIDMTQLGAAEYQPRLVWDRSIHDRYGDPGRPVTTTTSTGRTVVLVHDDQIYLSGTGASPEGDRPFLDRMNLKTFETERLWQCPPEAYEYVIDVLSEDASQILTSYETPNDPPNYFVRDLGGDGNADRRITNFEDPAPQLRSIRKELVTYERNDGVTLSATLYLPPDYQEGQRLPLIVWAYPREYSDPNTAGQISGSPYRFTRIGGASHLFLLLQGYAIMDNATMPVVGDPETMNDTFIEQIVASAKAAIDKAAAMGVADASRVGVGGHSYGAFMTANLLAHSDLFKAGIARSGAYNRTLTPFGFQSERRTLWEAPESYARLSPFMHAHKINEPILFIHGEMDNNSGTFPMQSERMYHAIKGHGGVARLVMLPYESHGYVARESVLHTLAEMIEWLDTHVKYAPQPPASTAQTPAADTEAN